MQVVRNFGRYRIGFLAIVFAVIAVTSIGCGPVEETLSVTNEASTPAVQSYPYPPPNTLEAPVVAYPPPGETKGGTLLALDKPLSPGDTVVTGVGPPGLTVFILNITFMGEHLGSTIISEDGAFSIEVNPLQPNIRIGLAADIAAISLNPEDIQPGEDQISIPQVGYFYDSFVIVEK